MTAEPIDLLTALQESIDRARAMPAKPAVIRKIGHIITVSNEDISGALDLSHLIAASMQPDLRTPEQIEADRQTRIEQAQLVQVDVLAEHALRLAEAAPLVKPFLELHAPRFYGSGERHAVCDGCEGGSEYDADFPCSTYELALSLAPTNEVTL